MGRLAGFNYRVLTKRLAKAGFEFDRHARGSHEICYNRKTSKRTTIPHHPGDIPEGTIRAILNQAGITIDEFLRI